jgi:4,5-DOPA dioxygenase extradiol
MSPAPVLFISHGAPTFAIEPGVLGPQLQLLGAGLTGVKAVLVVSPHWQSDGVQVMTTSAPETVHDFGGFPPELYRLQYPARGAPSCAADAARLLARAGYEVTLNARRGFDHGAWVPLRFLLPRANQPVFQVSMPVDLEPNGAVKLGETLAPLREQGVLIVGSGSLTHNLHEFRQHPAQEASYAREFSDWIRQAVLRRDNDALTDYRKRAPHAARAHPTDEHYLPLLVATGAVDTPDTVQAIDGGITHGVLSMDSFVWGVPIAATASTRLENGA